MASMQQSALKIVKSARANAGKAADAVKDVADRVSGKAARRRKVKFAVAAGLATAAAAAVAAGVALNRRPAKAPVRRRARVTKKK